MLTLKELRAKDQKQLREELEKTRNEWAKTRPSVLTNQDKKSHELQKKKLYIAQILTVMNEKPSNS